MIAAAVIQTVVLLSSGAFNALLNPGSLSVEKQLFVSSVVLMMGFAQGFVLLLFKVCVRHTTGWNLRFGSGFLLAPLATAMSNPVNDRPGETHVTTPIATKTSRDGVATGSIVHDGYDSEDESFSTTSHFMPELDMVVEERRNVYTDIYLLGIATFTTTYCIDTVSPAPTTAFLSGLLIMSIVQSLNIIVILSRSTAAHTVNDATLMAMRWKRLLTVTSCIFATGSFVMFCLGLSNANVDVSSVNSFFDVTFSVVLPLITPWLLVTISPKQQPLRTLFECTPFVFTICFSFVLFFLATRGEISTIVRQLSAAAHDSINNNNNNNTNVTLVSSATLISPNSVVELAFHSDVNASLVFNMDLFSTTSVDSAGNIPMLLLAPLVKIPTIVVVIANVINRSNLVVITALLVTMSMREIMSTDIGEATHRAYCVALTLAVISLICNVAKYLKIPDCFFDIRHVSVRSAKLTSMSEGTDLDLERDFR